MRVLILLSVLLFTTHAVSLRVRGIDGPNPEVELISVKESSEQFEKEGEGENEGDDMEAWVEENIQILGYDEAEKTWSGYMEDGWSGEWLSYSEGGYWKPIKEKDIPDWVWDLLDEYYDNGDGEGEDDDDDWDDEGDGEGEDEDIDFPEQGYEHDGKTWYNWTEQVDGEDVVVIQFCEKDGDSFDSAGTNACTENYYRDGTWFKMDRVTQDPDDIHPFLHDIVNGNYRPDDSSP